ncbi:MAG: hypothetical protein IPH88_19405 [Bacteroidales bacterium]|nr:hypothetical protein [Bacteroidales bacterium]
MWNSNARKIFFILSLSLIASLNGFAQENLIYHDIQTDAKGMIVPWYNPDNAVSFDHCINLVWNFWDKMRTDPNGLPYYMNHQVWEENFNDRRGIGGDQIQMALSAWRMLYAYSGNEAVKTNMRFMADYYLSHSLSPENAFWPDIPYPYNCLIYSGIYDGDMVIGKGYTQPDKAGSFGYELVNLYKLTDQRVYLDAAIKIANTLANHTKNGDSLHSPMPFKVHAVTGKVGTFTASISDTTSTGQSCYTSNWAPTLSLFLSLQELNAGNTKAYGDAFNKILVWMKAFPLVNNRWGPFFEDVSGWSDTQINAMTFARFIMEHPSYFPNWQKDVRGIMDWVYHDLGNNEWKKYGVLAVNEQSSFPVPGNSHTARQGADELLYCKLSGDMKNYDLALRQLIWATYMVDDDGKNRFPTIEIWLTDGYGDYARHYLRAMAAFPELAPAEDHILSSTSVVQEADYDSRFKKEIPDGETGPFSRMYYKTYDSKGVEQIRLNKKPGKVILGGRILSESANGEGYSWESLSGGGCLTIRRLKGNEVLIKY